MWGIHAGRTGDAETLFLKKGRIAIGWDKVSDLRKVTAERDAVKKAVSDAYPEKKPLSVSVSAGQLFRFANEIKVGDWVAYPSKLDRKVHVGRVEGGYVYDPKGEPGYPHQRPVKWVGAVPRTSLTQGALYELGSAISLFQVKNYRDEIIAAVQGKPTVSDVEKDPTVKVVVEEIEESTRDFVLKCLSTDLKGHPMASFVAHLLGTMGYHTRISPEGPDGGIDIVAHKDELGVEPPIIKVQVKSTEGSVGDPIVSALYGKVASSEFGLLVTLGTVTAQARAFARSKPNLRLIDGNELVGLVLAHYEDFDSQYKGLIPLKRVYVPQPIEDETE